QSIQPFSDVPPPPPRPQRFYSRQQLKEYLQKVHEYYSIVGRPRFGRSDSSIRNKMKPKEAIAKSYTTLIDGIVDYLDMNKDGCITRNEYSERILSK
ncbi:unnamed protein product, partial [Didymodactylos carnosus]